MPRKRFSAFEDFPVEPQATPGWQPDSPEAVDLSADPSAGKPAHQVAEPVSREEHSPAYVLSKDPGGSILSQPQAPQVERIERLKPSQMMPDRFQPRRLLPTSLRSPFFSGQITCYQAAEKWLKLAKEDSSLQAEVDRLLAMGLSFEEHGQIKPITGSWVESPDGSYRFQIETGERRFWAACLQFVHHGLRQEPLLRVEVVAAPTRMRQVLENRHAEPPSAVGQACEVASLILAEMGQTPSGTETDEFEFFRRARAQRMPAGLWDKLMPVMQLTRPRMVQLLNILDLPTPLLDQADRYRVPERVLREVLAAPQPQWDALLRASIHNSLTSDDVAELTQRPKALPKTERKAAPPDPALQAINAFKRFAIAIQSLDEDTQSAVLDELANDLVLAEGADPIITHLRDLAERLRIRQLSRTRRR